MKKNKEKNNNNKIVVELGVKLDKKSLKIAERKIKRLLSMAKQVDKLTNIENKKEFKVPSKDYVVLTKSKYIKDMIYTNKCSAREAQEIWNRVRGDYEFVISDGNRIYNVDYFNNHVLQKKSFKWDK